MATEVRPFPALELAGLAAMIVAAVFFYGRARRQQAPRAPALTGAVDLLCGLVIVTFISAHLVAVLARPFRDEGLAGAAAFTYDFRFYSLVLLGVLILVPSLQCLRHSWRLTKGDVVAYRRVINAILLLLAVNAPLMPLQGFAVGFTVFLIFNLAVLFANRKYFADERKA